MRAIHTSCLLLLSTLVLGACAGTPAFVRLADTQWQLSQLDTRPIDLEASRREPYLLMHGESQRVEGFGGCNRINGTYSGGGESLRFDSLASTRRYCANVMDQEDEFMRALERTATADVDGDTLTLLDRAGRSLAQFEAQPSPR